MDVSKLNSNVSALREELMACSFGEAIAVQTLLAAQKSLACLLVLKKSEVSKANCAKKKLVTLQGSKSYAAHAHEMRDLLKKELSGEIIFFYDMNCSECGWTTKEAESHYNQMLDLLQEQNSQLDPNEHFIPLKESEICEQVLGKRFSYVDQQRNPKKTRLEICGTSVENAALHNEVQDLRFQLKSMQTFLNCIPEEFFLQPIQPDASPSNGSNGDN